MFFVQTWSWVVNYILDRCEGVLILRISIWVENLFNIFWLYKSVKMLLPSTLKENFVSLSHEQTKKWMLCLSFSELFIVYNRENCLQPMSFKSFRSIWCDLLNSEYTYIKWNFTLCLKGVTERFTSLLLSKYCPPTSLDLRQVILLHSLHWM